MKISSLSLATTLILALASNDLNGQNISLNAFGGYTFQDKIDFSGGYGVIEDGAHWGASIELAVKDYMSAELLYQRQDTRSVAYGGGSASAGEGRLGINYIMIGAVKYVFTPDVRIAPYGGLAGGITVFEGKDISQNATRFAFGLKAGMLFEISETVGIRLQAQLLSPVRGTGAGFYFGTGGSGVGVSTYSSVYQFGLTAGLQFRLGM
jgi:hypothetical protein